MKGLHQKVSMRDHSRGYYTIVIVTVLGLLTLLASRSMTTATQDAVRLSVQEQVNTEAFYAAEQVMGQAVTWIQNNTPTYTSGTSATYTSSDAGVSDVVISASVGGTANDRTYTTEFWYVQGTDAIRAFARASNSQGSATVSQWLADEPIITVEALGQPWAMTGCLSDVTGTPEINAVSNDGSTPASYTSIQVSSSCGLPSSSSNCKAGPYGNLNRQGNSCTEDLYADLSTVADLWDATFNITRTEMETLAGASSSDNIFWFSSGSGDATDSPYGSPTSPAILIFEDCPGFQGNATIIGIIFSDASSCDLQGWGNHKIKGSMIVNGDVTKFTANAVFEAAYIEGSDSELSSPNDTAFDENDFAGNIKLLPGTWTDTDAN